MTFSRAAKATLKEKKVNVVSIHFIYKLLLIYTGE